jgi:geranylgeranyl pyrophosphate synthase
MSIDEAKAYAKTLTDESISAVEAFDGSEILIELAKFLLTRKK